MSNKIMYKRYIFPILMGCSMSIVMSFVNLGKISFPDILIIMAVQITVASIASFIFPAGLIGAKITKKHFPELKYVPFIMISSVIPAVFLTAIMACSGMLMMKGYSDEFVLIYLVSLPKFIPIGYCISLTWNAILDSILMPKKPKNNEKPQSY